MGHFENDTEGNYEESSDTSVEAQFWNAGSVYFDDEVVEYQGKLYIALDKTCAEVPGRSNKWKELITKEDDVSYDMDASVYRELPTKVVPNSVKTKAPLNPKSQERNIATKKTMPKKPIPLKSTVNPAHLKTLKEQNEEKLSKPQAQVVERKMQMTPSEQSRVNEVLKTIDFKKIKGFNSDEHNIIKNLILPQTQDEYKFVWESSHGDIISSKGKVNRPQDFDIAVNLSLTVRLNKVSSTRFFTLWVKADEKVLSDEECVELVYEALDFEHIKGLNKKTNKITNDLELLTHGLYDTQIFWASEKRHLIDETGCLHSQNLSKNTKIRLYAIIVKANNEKLKTFNLTIDCLHNPV